MKVLSGANKKVHIQRVAKTRTMITLMHAPSNCQASDKASLYAL